MRPSVYPSSLLSVGCARPQPLPSSSRKPPQSLPLYWSPRALQLLLFLLSLESHSLLYCLVATEPHLSSALLCYFPV